MKLSRHLRGGTLTREDGKSPGSFNFLPGVGRTYGEGIESGWSHMNPISMSTKEMGPALRQEVLDDHWGSWNWMKILNFGMCLFSSVFSNIKAMLLSQGHYMSRCFRDACAMQEKHSKIFDEYNATFPTHLTQSWDSHISKWNKDHSLKPDPYEAIEIRMFIILLC